MEELVNPARITEAHKAGLARAYADVEYRDYLNHAIAIANHNVLESLRLNKTDSAKEFAVRLDTLKKLLEKGKIIYSQAEKIKRTPLSELSKDEDAKS